MLIYTITTGYVKPTTSLTAGPPPLKRADKEEAEGSNEIRMHETSWVRNKLGTKEAGHERSWARNKLGTKQAGCEPS